MRISQENVNSFRTKSDQSQTPRRSQKTQRLTFKKSQRLLTRQQFKAAGSGERFIGEKILIDARKGKIAKLGISAPKQMGKAHDRNYFKRLLREVFRQNYASLPPYEMSVFPKKGVTAFSFEELLTDLLNFSKRYEEAESRTTKSR